MGEWKSAGVGRGQAAWGMRHEARGRRGSNWQQQQPLKVFHQPARQATGGKLVSSCRPQTAECGGWSQIVGNFMERLWPGSPRGRVRSGINEIQKPDFTE